MKITHSGPISGSGGTVSTGSSVDISTGPTTVTASQGPGPYSYQLQRVSGADMQTSGGYPAAPYRAIALYIGASGVTNGTQTRTTVFRWRVTSPYQTAYSANFNATVTWVNQTSPGGPTNPV